MIRRFFIWTSVLPMPRTAKAAVHQKMRALRAFKSLAAQSSNPRRLA